MRQQFIKYTTSINHMWCVWGFYVCYFVTPFVSLKLPIPNEIAYAITESKASQRTSHRTKLPTPQRVFTFFTYPCTPCTPHPCFDPSAIASARTHTRLNIQIILCVSFTHSFYRHYKQKKVRSISRIKLKQFSGCRVVASIGMWWRREGGWFVASVSSPAPPSPGK